MKMIIAIMIIVCSVMFAVAQTCWKTGLQQRGFSMSVGGFISLAGSPLIWAGFALMAVGTVMWFAVLSKTELSLAYPLVSLSYIFGLLAAKYVFHETVSLVRWLGVVLICLGVALIAKHSG